MEVKIESPGEINTIFGRCRCCSEYGYMKNLWMGYEREGQREVYGEMLIETFSIAYESTEKKAYICESCVERLRESSKFKKEILSCEHLEDEDFQDAEDESKDSIWSQLNFKEDIETAYDTDGGSMEYGQMDDSGEEYEQVEYLDEYAPMLRETQKKKRSGRVEGRTYKEYSEADMRQCLEAVKAGAMSISQAAHVYNVPRKTVTARVYNWKHNRDTASLAKSKEDEQYRLVEDVKKVLEYTTAVPFKMKASKLYCAFCYTSRDHFDEVASLRVHNKIHEEDMPKQVDRMLRPYFMNEILRVDVDVFGCRVCSVPIPSWSDMFVHLKEIHNVELEEAYTRLIPYKLRGDLVYCALCKEEFPNFQFLDAHMNLHYCNYMCSECGDAFVTKVRLKQHETIHKTGRYPCKKCGKVFSLEKYRRKHVAMVHKEQKLFKCTACGESFHSEYERHMHTVDHHPERIRVSTCEQCGKSFNWKPYYLAHLRKAHWTVKKHVCQYCDKRFISKHEVRTHEMRHTGGGKHACLFCDKKYVTLGELKKHSLKHLNDIEVLETTSLEL